MHSKRDSACTNDARETKLTAGAASTAAAGLQRSPYFSSIVLLPSFLFSCTHIATNTIHFILHSLFEVISCETSGLCSDVCDGVDGETEVAESPTATDAVKVGL